MEFYLSLEDPVKIDGDLTEAIERAKTCIRAVRDIVAPQNEGKN